VKLGCVFCEIRVCFVSVLCDVNLFLSEWGCFVCVNEGVNESLSYGRK
jgi:hypothetical protein